MANDATKNLRANVQVVLDPQSERTFAQLNKLRGILGGGGSSSGASGSSSSSGSSSQTSTRLAITSQAATSVAELKRISDEATNIESQREKNRITWMNRSAILQKQERERVHAEELKAERQHTRELEKVRTSLSKTALGSASYWAGSKLDAAGMSGAADTVRGIGAGWNKVSAGAEIAWGWMGKLRRGFLYFTVLTAAFNMLLKPLDAVYSKLAQIGMQGVKTILSIGKSAITSAGEMEYLRFRMDAIFGEQGKKNFEWLSTFTVGMPFDIAQLGDAFNMLGVYGVESLVDIKRAMVGVTDTAAALNRAPIDVAQAIGLGAKGAPGGMRRLRQFGITPAEIYGAGGVAGKNQAGLDPNHAAQNAMAIMTVLEAKFGGVGAKMANTWTQIVNDMGDMWKRFTLAISNTEGFKFIEGTLSALRSKFMEFTSTGELDKWANQFSSIFVSVKPVVEFIAARLPGALKVALAYGELLAQRFSTFLGSKQGGFTAIFEGSISVFEKMIPLFQTLTKFYFDLKITSMELMATLGQAVAWINWLLVKLPGHTDAQRKDALNYYNQVDALRGKFAADGSGSMRQAAHDFADTAATDLTMLLGQLRSMSPDTTIKSITDQFDNTLNKRFKQGSEDLAQGITQGVTDAQQFLSSASSLDVMGMLTKMRSGMSANQAAKAVEEENKLRRDYGKQGMAGGIMFGKGLTPAQMLNPNGAVSYGSGDDSPISAPVNKFSESVDKFADVVDGTNEDAIPATTTTQSSNNMSSGQTTIYYGDKGLVGGQIGPGAADGGNGLIANSKVPWMFSNPTDVVAGSGSARYGSKDPTFWGEIGYGGGVTAAAGGGLLGLYGKMRGWWGRGGSRAARGGRPLGEGGGDPFLSARDAYVNRVSGNAGEFSNPYTSAAETAEGIAARAAGGGGTAGRMAAGEASWLGRAGGFLGKAGRIAGEYSGPIMAATSAYEIYSTYHDLEKRRAQKYGPATKTGIGGLNWAQGMAGNLDASGRVVGGVTINFNGPVTSTEHVTQAVRDGLSGQASRKLRSAAN